MTNKIALVTGGSRGIGLAIAEELANRGMRVAACDINPESAKMATDFFQSKSIDGRGFVMDVTKPESIETAFNEITSVFGEPEILVNNAGITRDNLLMRMSDLEWDQVINTNLSSVFMVTRRSVRSMIKARWGRIVNIASVVGISGNAGQTNYSSSKAGVIGFTKSLAREVASRNITVNAVAPGFIETIMTEKLSPEHRENMLKTVPLARIGKPSDVAKAVAFLVSDDAAYITGVVLRVDGGMVMA